MQVVRTMLLATGALYLIVIASTFLQTFSRDEVEIIPFFSEQDIQKFLEGQNMRGEWVSSSPSALLDNQNGAIQAYFTRYLNISSYHIGMFKNPLSTIVLWIHDPYYRDDKLLKITNYISYKIENGTLQMPQGNNSKFSVITYEDTQYTKELDCELSGKIETDPTTITSTGLNTTQFKQSNQVLRIQLTASQPCNLDLSINLKVSPITNSLKCVWYSMFLITIVMLNWFGALKLIDNMLEDLNYVNKLSLVTAMIVCCQDSFVLIFNLTFGMNFASDLNYFLIFFLFFLLFTFVDFRVMLSIWRFQNSRQLADLSEHQLRKKIYCFQAVFYVVLLAYNYFMWKYFLHRYFVLLNSLILLPQIYHNFVKPTIVSFDKNFFILFSAIKYLIFFYFRGCPVNIMMLKYYYFDSTLGLFILVVSILVLFLQSRLGGKFFVPRAFLRTYDYFIDKQTYLKERNRADLKDNEVATDLCPICYTHLCDDQVHPEGEIETRSSLFGRLLRKKKDMLMVTPCQHTFHPSCLLKWIETKMECPTCRAALPQIY